MNNFAEWLDRTLSNRGPGSASALAKKLAISESRISKWRAGQATPHFEMVVKVATAIGADPMRLAATAGRVPEELGGTYQPLPIPPIDETEAVKAQIMRWRGVSEEAKKRMIRIYEEDIAIEEGGEGDDDNESGAP